MEHLKIEYLLIGDLKPYEQNARQHGEPDVEAIAASIREFGFDDPIGIWGDENLIVEGHGRLLAAERLNMKQVPVIRLDHLTDEQRRAYALAHNKTAELSGWNFATLDSELAQIAEIDMSLFGFNVNAVDPQIEIVEDEIPEDVETRCKPGDLWQLGNHRLICGDSTSVDNIDKLTNGQKLDIVITSPPYGAGASAKLRDHYVPGRQALESFYIEHKDDPQEWGDLIRSAFDVMKIYSVAQFINLQMLADNKTDLIGFVNDNANDLCDIMIWNKGRAAPQMQDNILNNQYEFIFIFGNSKRTVPFGDFHGNISNVIDIHPGANQYSNIHKAVYPAELPARIMQIASKSKTVLDPFGGTGTTMIACEQLNRRCFMCELDPKYVDVIIDRWETLTGEKAVLLNG